MLVKKNKNTAIGRLAKDCKTATVNPLALCQQLGYFPAGMNNFFKPA